MTQKKLISGFATPEGTVRYKTRFQGKLDASHFRERNNLWFSSIGMGSYLGESDDATDASYIEGLKEAVVSGVNVIDSAINYRSQRSERSFGRALSDLIESGTIKRDEVILCTKGGFLPFDGSYPPDPMSYFKKTYIETGILKPEEIVEGCHAMTPRYLEDQLKRSCENLGVETLDIYYLHNPETQLAEIDRKSFNERLRTAFEFLEKKVSEGKIRYYGTATWNGYRVSPEKDDYLSLEDMVLIAREAGGVNHHFKAIQLPINLAMPEAWVLANQRYGASLVPLLGMAERVGVTVIGSAALLQARLTGQLPEYFTRHFPNLKTSAQYCLQFARSLPGVTTSLVGMKNKEHVRENLETAKIPALTEEQLFMMFQKAE